MKVHPPQPEGEPGSRNRDEYGVAAPALGFDNGTQRRDGPDDTLAKGDDRQQPVSFGDVVRVPRCPTFAPFGDDRADHLDQHAQGGPHEEHLDGRVC